MLGEGDNTLSIWHTEPDVWKDKLTFTLNKDKIGFADNIKCLAVAQEETMVAFARRKQLSLAFIDSL